jgi:hypothetical protein
MKRTKMRKKSTRADRPAHKDAAGRWQKAARRHTARLRTPASPLVSLELHRDAQARCKRALEREGWVMSGANGGDAYLVISHRLRLGNPFCDSFHPFSPLHKLCALLDLVEGVYIVCAGRGAALWVVVAIGVVVGVSRGRVEQKRLGVEQLGLIAVVHGRRRRRSSGTRGGVQ